MWLTLWMVAWIGGGIGAHYIVHGVVNGWQAALTVFLAINVLICFWEISLGARIGDIERWVHDPAAAGKRPRGSLYFVRVTPAQLFSTELWARVWLEYSRFDPGYADRRSFGFSIDVGNGWSTLVPSIVFGVGMTFEIMSPVVLGLLGALIFYQKLYCTCLYFFSYFFNRRYEGHRVGQLLAVVGGSNGVWLVFPAIGLYVCVRLILDGSFAIIWS